MRIGEIEITPLSDGRIAMPKDYFIGADWSSHQDLLEPDGTFHIPIGCFLLRAAGPTVLVDAGLGPLDNPMILESGKLPDALAAAGVRPGDVDVVVCTHLHFDHVGWLVRDRAAFFPNATVRFGRADWDHFVGTQNENDPGRAAAELLSAAGRVELLDGDGAIAPGVTSLHAPGHTPGHSCVVVSSGEERAILLGDAVTCPVQLQETEWQAMSDVDSALAKRTRESLWQEIEGSGAHAVAAHFPGLQFGRVLRAEGKRYFS